MLHRPTKAKKLQVASCKLPDATYPQPATRNRQLISIPLDKLHPHPGNRKITHDDVEDLAESLQEHGQREPIRVRPLADPIGHYEIISGGRRYAAAITIDLESLTAIVEEHSTPKSLVELAIANSHRLDLDPISRGELLARLIAPIADGGAGMERAAAGRIFGLNADSSVRNALRILDLPTFWRGLLRTKEIPESLARALVPYPAPVLEAFAKDLQNPKEAKHLAETLRKMAHDATTDSEIYALRDWLYENSRPMDETKHYHGYQLGHWKCLFDVDKLPEAQQKELAVCVVPSGEKKNPERKISLNPKLWHKLQDPPVKAQAAKKQSGPKEVARKNAKSTKVTAAEIKARAKEADERLDKYTSDWLRIAYRCGLAENATSKDDYVFELLPWLLAALRLAHCSGPQIERFLSWAIAEIQGPKNDGSGDRNWDNLRTPTHRADNLVKLLKPQGLVDDRGTDVGYVNLYMRLWRLTLWPVSAHSDESKHHKDLVSAGTLPDRLPQLSDKAVDQLAAIRAITPQTIWLWATTADSSQRQLVARWLLCHTKDQLITLAKEWSMTFFLGDSRDRMVEQILAQHKPGKPLALPARLGKYMGETTAKKAKSTK